MELLTPPDKEQLVVSGVFLAIVLAIGGGFYAWKAPRRGANARFASAIEGYLSQAGEFSKAPAEYVEQNMALCGDKGHRCRRGKLVVVDVEKREIDAIHLELPDAVRADSPQEVGSVVLLFTDRKATAWYGPFSRGYTVTWDMRVVDQQSRKMAAMISYTSGAPRRAIPIPFYKHGGWRPTRGLIDDLAGLPAL